MIGVSNFLLIIEYRGILSASKKTSTKSLEFELRSLPKHLHSQNFAYILLLNRPYENEGTLRGQNPPLKCCKPIEIFTCFQIGLDLQISVSGYLGFSIYLIIISWFSKINLFEKSHNKGMRR